MPIPTASGVSQLVVAVARTLLLAGGISGCVAKHVVPVSSTGTPSYKRLSIEYAVEGGTLSRILSVSEPPGEHDLVDGGEAWHDPKSDVVPETGQPRADTDDRDRETSFNTVEHAKLLIEYPHPEERLGYALATLEFHQEPLDYQERNVVQQVIDAAIDQVRFDSPKSRTDQQSAVVAADSPGSAILATNAGETRTAPQKIVMDVPRSQIDFLLMDLANSGFLDDQTRPSNSVRLDLRIDHGQIRKPWSREPRLDDIIHVLVEHGAEFDPTRNEYHRRLPEKRRRSLAGRSSLAH